MIEKHEIDALEKRATAARVKMSDVCDGADPPVIRASFYRARSRGRMDVGLFARLEKSMAAIEASWRRSAQCPHGEPIASRCDDCAREHLEATA